MLSIFVLYFCEAEVGALAVASLLALLMMSWVSWVQHELLMDNGAWDDCMIENCKGLLAWPVTLLDSATLLAGIRSINGEGHNWV